jgi:hypothetical protein
MVREVLNLCLHNKCKSELGTLNLDRSVGALFAFLVNIYLPLHIMLVEEFVRLRERRMMSLERKGIKERGRAGHNKGLRRIHETKKEQVQGGCKKYSPPNSIICAYLPPPPPKNCRLIKFRRCDILKICSTHGG